ncbi:phospho-N-acetylmuramoyl-pentapeptide-transferase [Micrococcales bacterium 31B]|nr:phospho-N-acetylmuramoyl-pentapeptide-transferase [Micrococcales bacterium 31B]
MGIIMIAGILALLVSLLGTPIFIRFLTRKRYGQFIRDDGPTSHHSKKGTPTMGGVLIISGTLVGYFLSHVIMQTVPSISVGLAMFMMLGLGLLGFLDDFIKIKKERSEGLKPRGKYIGQVLIATIFAVLALQFPNAEGVTPASTAVSLIRDTALDLAFGVPAVGIVLFAIWANFIVVAWSNGVNLTDGLDGLATGISIVVFGAYVLICLWQAQQLCGSERVGTSPACYEVRDPLDLAVFASAIVGSCIGFLWWNTSKAKIFMGDTGSLSLGGALVAVTILSRTELLGVLVGIMFVVITASVAIQIGVFKATRKRVFKMAPLQHHFEMMNWPEVTIVVRFWIIALIGAALALGIFYGEWQFANG